MTHLTEATAARREERRQRLAAQLRSNLGRRKQQDRARQETDEAPQPEPQQSEGEPR
ncbi:hypothetical protein [Ferrovibrio sp.]|uniref:hypothetical protein n=1 Tax=Ferrovibrio sp. TaxID=1917215 RepID=UPI003D104E38